MKDLLSGLTAGGWGLLAGWIIPTAVAVSLVAYLVIPELPWEFAEEVGELSSGEQAAALAFTAVGLGVVLNALQAPLYRLLEGYVWPASVRDRAIARHTNRRAELRNQLANASGLEYGLLLERLHRYPTLEGQVAPTTLGNAIRAFEAYGWDKYGLDSQTLWSELEALAPESLRVAIERARVPVDFAVSFVYLSALVGLISLASVLLEADAQVKLLVIAVGALSLSPIWYWLAVVSTSQWYASVQALVNLGRLPLAQAMNLQIPATLEEERRMWEALTTFVSSEDFDVAALDSYRGHAGSPSAEKHGGQA